MSDKYFVPFFYKKNSVIKYQENFDSNKKTSNLQYSSKYFFKKRAQYGSCWQEREILKKFWSERRLKKYKVVQKEKRVQAINMAQRQYSDSERRTARKLFSGHKIALAKETIERGFGEMLHEI